MRFRYPIPGVTGHQITEMELPLFPLFQEKLSVHRYYREWRVVDEERSPLGVGMLDNGEQRYGDGRVRMNGEI